MTTLNDIQNTRLKPHIFLHLSFFILNIFKSLLIKRKVLYFYGFFIASDKYYH